MDLEPGPYDVLIAGYRGFLIVTGDHGLDLTIPATGTASVRGFGADGTVIGTNGTGPGPGVMGFPRGGLPTSLGPGIKGTTNASFGPAQSSPDGTYTLGGVHPVTDADIHLGRLAHEVNGPSVALRVPVSSGSDLAFAFSRSVSSPARPSPPEKVTATAAGASATVQWQPPAAGPTVDRYVVTARGEGTDTRSVFVTGSEHTASIGPLTPGVAHRFTVTAMSASAASAPSGTTRPLTPLLPPSAPSAVTATTPGPNTGVGVTLSWRLPDDDVQSDNGSTWLTGQDVIIRSAGLPDTVLELTYSYAVRTATIGALEAGRRYSFTVRARNAAGLGPESQSLTVTAGPAVASGPPAGYWMVAADGAVYAFGGAKHSGQATPSAGSKMVDVEPTPGGDGYWMVDDRGRVAARGGAAHLGDASGLRTSERVSSIASTPSGAGYWLFTSFGRVLAFGDAQHLGDMAATVLNGPVLDSVATPTGRGYYMVASDGGIFSFGDATFRGSMGGRLLNAPVQSLVPAPNGAGYWLVASDGGVFAFDAPFKGSMGAIRLNRPVTGMVSYGDGYLMVGEDGGIFNFSSLPFSGSLGDRPPAAPIVAVASTS